MDVTGILVGVFPAANAVGKSVHMIAKAINMDKSLHDFCFINFLPSFSRKLLCWTGGPKGTILQEYHSKPM